MRAIIPFLTIFFPYSMAPNAGESAWMPLTYDPNADPADNPLKGFVPFSGEYDFPHGMEFDASAWTI